jgi:hypothetical protein
VKNNTLTFVVTSCNMYLMRIRAFDSYHHLMFMNRRKKWLRELVDI